MKFIFSRKGFDSENGGTASPVMPDGAMISMPIPSNNNMKFEDISYNGRTYMDIWQDLKPNEFNYFENCHLDPDLRNIGKESPVDSLVWRPAFGQADAAESHLENQGIGIGDVFLFFGWFRQTEEKDGVLKYKKGSKDAHMMYGYLQIGEIVRGKDFSKYPWHPHAEQYLGDDCSNNTLYVAADKLIIDGVDTGLPGAGTFKYSDEIVLTMPGQTKSRWQLPDFFKNVSISCHSASCFKPEGYFQTVRIGQEFVISESKEVTEWAKGIIINNYDNRIQQPFPESIRSTRKEAAEAKRIEVEKFNKKVSEVIGTDTCVKASVEVRVGNEYVLETREFLLSPKTYAEYMVNVENGETVALSDAEESIFDEIYEFYDLSMEDADCDELEPAIELFSVVIYDPNLLDYLSEICTGHKVDLSRLSNCGGGIYNYKFEYEFSINSKAMGSIDFKVDGDNVKGIEKLYSEVVLEDSSVEVIPGEYTFEEAILEIIS